MTTTRLLFSFESSIAAETRGAMVLGVGVQATTRSMIRATMGGFTKGTVTLGARGRWRLRRGVWSNTDSLVVSPSEWRALQLAVLGVPAAATFVRTLGTRRAERTIA